MPRYSESVAGANISDSATPWVTSPSITLAGNPASSSAALASRAYCSMVNLAGLAGLRAAGSSVMPTIAASPRSPMSCLLSWSGAAGQADRRGAGHQDLRHALLATDLQVDQAAATV